MTEINSKGASVYNLQGKEVLPRELDTEAIARPLRTKSEKVMKLE